MGLVERVFGRKIDRGSEICLILSNSEEHVYDGEYVKIAGYMGTFKKIRELVPNKLKSPYFGYFVREDVPMDLSKSIKNLRRTHKTLRGIA